MGLQCKNQDADGAVLYDPPTGLWLDYGYFIDMDALTGNRCGINRTRVDC